MTNRKTVAVFSGLLAFAIQGQAQTGFQEPSSEASPEVSTHVDSIFQINFKGTIQSTNHIGTIVSQKLSNKTYLDDAMAVVGTNNSLSLVYVQNASADPSAPGDFVEVMNATNHALVYTNLQFMYGGPFPPALTNFSGDAYVAGAQVIPLPLAGSGSTLGGATIDERTMQKRTIISGSFNYTSQRSAGSTNNDMVRVFSGTFSVGKQITP